MSENAFRTLVLFPFVSVVFTKYINEIIPVFPKFYVLGALTNFIANQIVLVCKKIKIKNTDKDSSKLVTIHKM